ncbi:MAG TPA: hypothetical protein VKY79_03065 [Actinomycetaceae bacterium]|nr:hypothetical protein [Actinomycetaceae bacterium]
MSVIDSPAVKAARLTGQRRAFIEHLSDADRQTARTDRAVTMLTPAGLIDWQASMLPGDVSAYGHAEAALGGEQP